jgi:HEAT repeat protein
VRGGSTSTGRLLLGLVLLAGACTGGDSSDPEPKSFALGPVVATHIERLEAEMGEAPALPPAEEGDGEEIDGLVEMLAGGDHQFRPLALAAISQDFGPRAIPRLAAALGSTARPWQERAAASELLAALDHPAATQRLLEQLESAPEAWLRRWCAYHLIRTSGDWIVPRLLKRLKYEKDHEAFIWLAVALAKFDNYSGLDGLLDVSRRGATEAIRAQAQEQLQALADELELSPDELHRRWNSIDAEGLPQPEPSAALRLEVWRLVAAMGDDTIQLRGVDDARFVLCRLGPWAAVELSPALADEDLHLRLHTAQVLERMGARASAAGPALLRALAEPLLAPNVAEALGRVGYPPARAALEARTEPGVPHELRVACVRALGRLGLVESLPVLRARFEAQDEAADLRMAAATALVLLDQGDLVASWLIEQLGDSGADPPAAEIALETWLARGLDQGRTGFEAALEAWRALIGPPGITPGLEEMQARRDRRAESLAERVGALLGG